MRVRSDARRPHPAQERERIRPALGLRHAPDAGVVPVDIDPSLLPLGDAQGGQHTGEVPVVSVVAAPGRKTHKIVA